LNHALDPFFTTKGDKGSGLGLSMVYDTAKLAGGQLKLANTDTGASVTLRLPFRPAAQHSAHDLVLLVEDSPDLRQAIRDMLTGLGHSVIEATSAEEACALVQGVPDIAFILSDISLEGDAPGTTLVHAVHRTPVYLMTSLPVTDPRYAEAVALAPVLSKPFNQTDLATFLGHEAAHS
ncbi:MAG TPA: response regulator, partial [Marivita sp.]|nr:response regulator [Marivita sp.]